MKIRSYVVACLSILASGMIAGNVSYAEVPGVTDTEIKIGNHSSQTGGASSYGVVQRVMKAYFEEINEKGGIYGRKINFLIGDSATNNQQALQTIKKQVEQDNIFAVFAAQGTPHVAVYQYLANKGVPDLWCSAYEKALSDPPIPTTFPFTPGQADEAKMYSELINKKFKGKKIGLLVVNSQSGLEFIEEFEKHVDPKLIVASEKVDLRTLVDAKAQVLKFKEAGAEVVYLGLPNPARVGNAIRFAAEQNYKPQWLLISSGTVAPSIAIAGSEAIEGAIGQYEVFDEEDTNQPGIVKHLEFMKRKLPNEKPSSLSVNGQAYAEVTVEVLKKAGKNLTRESLVKAAENLKNWKCSVCRSSTSTSPTQHRLYRSYPLLRATGGKWVPLK